MFVATEQNEEVACEYRRSVARPQRGRAPGTQDVRRSYTNGRSVMLIVVLMTYSTLSMTRRSSWWRGVGYGTTRAGARPALTGSHHDLSPLPGSSSMSCEMTSRLVGSLQPEYERR